MPMRSLQWDEAGHGSHESQPQNSNVCQSLLLNMPTEVLHIILGYVLSTSKYISASPWDFLECRIEQYEKACSDKYDMVDEEDEEIIDDEEILTIDSPRELVDTTVELEVEDLPLFCADSGIVSSSSEELQEYACNYCPIICRHKIKQWNSPYPQILSSCRLLNRIGKGLLPANKTMSIVYHYRDNCYPDDFMDPDLSRFVAGESSVAAALKKYPELRSVKTWSLSIYIDISGDDLWCDYFDVDEQMKAIQDMIQEDIRALQEIQELTTLFIELRDLDELSESEGTLRSNYYRFFCNPFRVLRASNVDMHLPYEELPREMEAELTGHHQPYHMLLNKTRIEKLIDEFVRESDYLCWTGYDFISLYEIEDVDYSFVPNARLPTMPALPSLESAMSDMRTACDCWDLDEAIGSILLILHYLQGYLELASDRVGRFDVSRPIPRWAATIAKSLQRWKEEFAELVNVHETARAWYAQLYE